MAPTVLDLRSATGSQSHLHAMDMEGTLKYAYRINFTQLIHSMNLWVGHCHNRMPLNPEYSKLYYRVYKSNMRVEITEIPYILTYKVTSHMTTP